MIRRNMNGYIAVIVALGIGLTANAATVRVTGGTLCLGNKLSATNFYPRQRGLNERQWRNPRAGNPGRNGFTGQQH